MKKWIAVTIIMAVVLLASIGLNAFQLGYNQQSNAGLAPPLNVDYGKIEWGKYFVLEFMGSDLNPFFGDVAGYDMNGSLIFEAGFFPAEKPWMNDDEKFGIDGNRLFIKLWSSKTIIKVSRITAGDVEIITPGGFSISPMKTYSVTITEVTSDGKTIGAIK
ncbi:MAG: hypothetical protein WCJ54_03085 [Actinomycetota bacterium]